MYPRAVSGRATVCAVALLFAALACGCGSEGSTPGFEKVSSSGAGGAGGHGSGGSTSSSTTSSTTTGTVPLKGPPYPIVLAHGFFGFEDFAGAGFLSYFYGVKDHLADEGETLVFTPAVDPFNTSEVRGAQLAQAIMQILAETGYAKVNIIGHSQGGLDARVVAHGHPDLVASVVTVAAPHFGTPIADIALELVADPNLQGVLDFLLDTVGVALWEQIGDGSSLADALWQFSQPAITEFNTTYFDQDGVYYASVTGRSDWHSGGSQCNTADAPPFIGAWDGELDPIDPLFSIPEMILDGGIGNPYPNDGLVRVQDAHWGVFLGCVPADHMDEVGQLFGDGPGFGNDWDYQQFYVDLVQFLRDQGF